MSLAPLKAPDKAPVVSPPPRHKPAPQSHLPDNKYPFSGAATDEVRPLLDGRNTNARTMQQTKRWYLCGKSMKLGESPSETHSLDVAVYGLYERRSPQVAHGTTHDAQPLHKQQQWTRMDTSNEMHERLCRAYAYYAAGVKSAREISKCAQDRTWRCSLQRKTTTCQSGYLDTRGQMRMSCIKERWRCGICRWPCRTVNRTKIEGRLEEACHLRLRVEVMYLRMQQHTASRHMLIALIGSWRLYPSTLVDKAGRQHSMSKFLPSIGTHRWLSTLLSGTPSIASGSSLR